ncbi:T9SS type A sorting domain-containing protein [Arcicella rosea]|uniref:Secretion system C-terminal sorting domain-containing protein n=1 Tax=Arcicella rosea TaxID=502909 RepID=A0A841ENZ9_9BACT|nr:T9SS type A sorting domain-containing protein [Arcicella rosea]MBB6002753.1 hypothetical protein [Arcicella rosea]
MFRKLPLLLLLMFFTFAVKGQSIGISRISPASGSNICLGNKVYLAYTTIGTFNQDNVFKVQVKSGYSGTWVDVAAKDSSGYLIASLPDEVFNISNNYSNYASLRIVSSSPAITSSDFSTYIYLPANVEIVDIQRKTLFPNEAVSMSVKNTGTTPVKLLMSDSTYFQIDNSYGTLQNIMVATSKSGTYKILSTSNLCGIGKSTGSVDIKIVDNSLKILGLTQNHICKNSKVTLKVQKTGKWSTANKFKIRLEDYNNSSKFYDLDVTENDDLMTATLSDNIPNTTYRVKVTASDNNIESDFFFSQLYVHNESKVDLTTESTSMKYGEVMNLKVSLNGYGNYFVELSDGQVYRYGSVGDYTSSFNFAISPKTTTQYFIKSFTSECGSGSGVNKVSITVNKAIKTDSLKEAKYCEGATAEVKFSTNASLPVGSAVKIKLTNNNYFGYNDTYLEVIGKVISDNVASFVIPSNLSATFYNTSFYASVFTDDIPATTFSPNYIRISAFPSANINNSYSSVTINLKKPQSTNIDVILNGNGPYEITMLDDTKYKYTDFYKNWKSEVGISMYIPKSSTVAIKSITNACGTNNSISSQYKYVAVENAEYGIQISSKKTTSIEACTGAKVDLSVLTEGKYGNDNQFTVELINSYGSYNDRTLGKITAGEKEITIPSNLPTGEYDIRVSSSNPLLYSNLIKLYVRALPTAEYNTYYTSVYNPGDYVGLSLSLKGGGNQQVTYKDGRTETIETYTYDGTSTQYYNFNIYKTTTFGIKSISNICGVGTVKNNDITFKVAPYSIQNMLNINSNYNNNSIQCLTDKILIPFNVKGQVPSGTTFSVQISNASDTTYTTIQTGITESPVLVSFPSKFQQAGSYNIRIVSNDNSVKSDVNTVNFKTAPNNLALQFNGGATVTEIEVGNGVYIYSNTSRDNSYGNILKYIIKDDKNFKTIGYNSYNYIEEYKNPTETTTYTLTSAINECGVGKVSGSVKVNIKPVVSMNFEGMYSGLSTCAGATLKVNLDSKGTFEADNVFKVYAVNENNTKTELLSSTKNGAYNVTFGSDLKRGSYKIQMESSNPYQTKTITTIALANKLDMTLMGSSTINPGTDTYLILRNNDSYKPNTNSYYYEYINYELSNGKTGILEFNSYSTVPTIYLAPLKTETFTVKTVRNACGLGKVDGSATITVNPPSNKQVNFQEYFISSVICAGSTINVPFYTVGTFSANNKFTVQLSDNTGKNFKSLETVEKEKNILAAKLPSDLVPSMGYSIRVIASDSNATSTTNKYPFSVLEGITARFDSSSYYFNENKPVSIGIKLTGTPPFTFAIGSDEVSAKAITINTNDYVLTINPTANTVYRLFSVVNSVCGTGTVLSPSTVRIELITGTDELGKMGINIFPNPASDVLNIESNDKELDVQLIDFVGKVVQEQTLRGVQKQVDLSRIPSGTYFLNIQKDGRKATFKVLKQ